MTETIAQHPAMVVNDQSQPLFRALLDRYRRRRDAAVLARLDDHTLRDIGLSRYDIEMLAKS